MIRLDGDRAVGILALAVVLSVGFAAVPVARRIGGGNGSEGGPGGVGGAGAGSWGGVGGPAGAGGVGGSGNSDGGPRGAAIVAAPPPPLDLTPLKRFAPFGTKLAGGGVAGDPALGLQLRGILLARPAAASIALIAAAGGPAKGYGPGAVLPGGAVVDAVEFDLVVLRVNGTLVTLALPAKPGGSFTAAGAAGPPVPAAAADPVEAHRAEVAAAPDPATLLGSLGATAGANGYRIGAALPDELRRAGLAPGDTIEKVDGSPVGDPAHDRALLDDAVVAGRMRVDVIRAGRPVTVTVQLH